MNSTECCLHEDGRFVFQEPVQNVAVVLKVRRFKQGLDALLTGLREAVRPGSAGVKVSLLEEVAHEGVQFDLVQKVVLGRAAVLAPVGVGLVALVAGENGAAHQRVDGLLVGIKGLVENGLGGGGALAQVGSGHVRRVGRGGRGGDGGDGGVGPDGGRNMGLGGRNRGRNRGLGGRSGRGNRCGNGLGSRSVGLKPCLHEGNALLHALAGLKESGILAVKHGVHLVLAGDVGAEVGDLDVLAGGDLLVLDAKRDDLGVLVDVLDAKRGDLGVLTGDNLGGLGGGGGGWRRKRPGQLSAERFQLRGKQSVHLCP